MNQSEISKVLSICIDTAKEQGFSSYDVSDLLKTKYVALTKKVRPAILTKALRLPYNVIQKRYPSAIRMFVKDKGYIYPQGQAMYIRGMVTLAKIGHPLADLQEAELWADWLIKNSSEYSKHKGWGQPYLWYSRKPFPANIPRATVSSQVGWAMLDLYEITNNTIYLDTAISTCRMFMEDFNYTVSPHGDFCLSYTTIDHYHIHNSSMLAASLMARVANASGQQELMDFAIKLADFTARNQNDDGSFYYWAPPDKLNYMIDNYHTGFVLESYYNLKEDVSDRYDQVYERGMNYYIENLFNGSLPRISDRKKYPVDIQSCAQSILTFCYSDLDEKFRKKALEVAGFAIDNMFVSSKGHFGYKLYGKGRLDESYYFRWGDAWMIRALALILKNL